MQHKRSQRTHRGVSGTRCSTNAVKQLTANDSEVDPSVAEREGSLQRRHPNRSLCPTRSPGPGSECRCRPKHLEARLRTRLQAFARSSDTSRWSRSRPRNQALCRIAAQRLAVRWSRFSAVSQQQRHSARPAELLVAQSQPSCSWTAGWTAGWTGWTARRDCCSRWVAGESSTVQKSTADSVQCPLVTTDAG